MESDGQDVYGLTDEELMEMLRERGVDVGPILGTITFVIDVEYF